MPSQHAWLLQGSFTDLMCMCMPCARCRARRLYERRAYPQALAACRQVAPADRWVGYLGNLLPMAHAKSHRNSYISNLRSPMCVSCTVCSCVGNWHACIVQRQQLKQQACKDVQTAYNTATASHHLKKAWQACSPGQVSEGRPRCACSLAALQEC